MSDKTFITPTTELEAVNIMLSGIGEAPVNSLDEVTADVSIAYAILAEIAKETQLEGWQWNTEDNYPLTPDRDGYIKVSPSAVRVAFREASPLELTMRGNKVYDRVNHSYIFPKDTVIRVTLTMLLPFEELPETARRYVTVRALRVFQSRVVGSQVLNAFSERDELQARILLLREERQQDMPNMLTGTQSATCVWKPITALRHRRVGGY